jgi:hypothetical protein
VTRICPSFEQKKEVLLSKGRLGLVFSTHRLGHCNVAVVEAAGLAIGKA